jgi:hypothetical protein
MVASVSRPSSVAGIFYGNTGRNNVSLWVSLQVPKSHFRLCVPKEEGKLRTGVSPDRLGKLIAEKQAREPSQNKECPGWGAEGGGVGGGGGGDLWGQDWGPVGLAHRDR